MSKEITIRFLLQNKDSLVIRATKKETFGQIKKKIWKRKKFPPITLRDYVCKMANSDMFFEDDELVSRYMDILPLFDENPKGGENPSFMELEIYPKKDFGDAFKLYRRMPSDQGNILIEGLLDKKTRGHWKKRYCVMQSHVLFVYDSKKNELLELFKVGSCLVKIIPSKDKKIQFELLLSDPIILRADNATVKKWVNIFYTLRMRTTKLVILLGCEALQRRNSLATEGIFRISGRKSIVDQLLQEYTFGNFPNLEEIKDEHAISGLIKQALRTMPEPIMTFELFEQFIQVTTIPSGPKKLELLKSICLKLPTTNESLLEYLMLFLKKVSTYQETSKMSSSNLALLFGPHLLRSRDNSASTALQFTGPITDVVRLLIDKSSKIWTNGRYRKFYQRQGGVLMDHGKKAKVKVTGQCPSGPPPLLPNSPPPPTSLPPLNHAISHPNFVRVRKDDVPITRRTRSDGGQLIPYKSSLASFTEKKSQKNYKRSGSLTSMSMYMGEKKSEHNTKRHGSMSSISMYEKGSKAYNLGIESIQDQTTLRESIDEISIRKSQIKNHIITLQKEGKDPKNAQQELTTLRKQLAQSVASCLEVQINKEEANSAVKQIVEFKKNFVNSCQKWYSALLEEQKKVEEAWDCVAELYINSPNNVPQEEALEASTLAEQMHKETGKWFQAQIQSHRAMVKDLKVFADKTRNRIHIEQTKDNSIIPSPPQFIHHHHNQHHHHHHHQHYHRQHQQQHHHYHRKEREDIVPDIQAGTLSYDENKKTAVIEEETLQNELNQENQQVYLSVGDESEMVRENSRTNDDIVVLGRAMVTFSHTGDPLEDELTIEEGDIIEILDNTQGEEGWWLGRKEDGSVGLFPSNYTKSM